MNVGAGRSYNAPKTDPRDKFNTANARELYAWIVPTVLKFQGALSARYRNELNSRGQIETLLDPHESNKDDDVH